jgi:hypothetical protein
MILQSLLSFNSQSKLIIMSCKFQAISHSWVAVPEKEVPLGVIEFIGGAGLGTLPTITYRRFLNALVKSGYTVIAVPFPLKFNHQAVAAYLKEERDLIRTSLNYPKSIPQIWVAHSLGCKYIALLEIQKDIIDQPSLLIAPNIGSTRNAVPFDWLARLLDKFNCGVRPSRETTKKWIESSINTKELFHITSLLSFKQDCISGNSSGEQECPKKGLLPNPPSSDDVRWLNNLLRDRPDYIHSFAEIDGSHTQLASRQIEQVNTSALDLIDDLRQVAKTFISP